MDTASWGRQYRHGRARGNPPTDLLPMRLTLFALGWLLVLAALAAWLVDSGRWTPARPDRARYPLLGVDVSRYQGEIDWPALADAGVRFAYVKATEGGDWTDPAFARNWRQSGEAEIARGAYHFFTFCRSPEDQAAHALAALPREGETLPLAVDVEYGGNCEDYGSEAEISARLDRFLQILGDSLGYAPAIYAVWGSYPYFVRGHYPESPVWIQNVVWEPSLENDREWALWQWSKAGRLPSVAGPVDLNVFRGDETAFQRFLRPPSADSLAARSVRLLRTIP